MYWIRENVGNQLPFWHEQRAIFPIKQFIQFCCTSSLSSHRRVIKPRQQRCRLLFMYILLPVASLYRREQLFVISPFLYASSCHMFIADIYLYICIDWTLLVPSTRKWRCAPSYTCIYFPSTNSVLRSISFVAYYIIHKLSWWTYTYTSGFSLAKTNIWNVAIFLG